MDGNNFLTCALCGHRFDAKKMRRSCSDRGCPLGVDCEKICCPNCGYSTVIDSPLTKKLTRLFRRRSSDRDS